jgi:hypothetical protein
MWCGVLSHYLSKISSWGLYLYNYQSLLGNMLSNLAFPSTKILWNGELHKTEGIYRASKLINGDNFAHRRNGGRVNSKVTRYYATILCLQIANICRHLMGILVWRRLSSKYRNELVLILPVVPNRGEITTNAVHRTSPNRLRFARSPPLI